MKRCILLLAILLPLISVAQVNDIYFVPTKEKKTVVVKSSEVNSFADIDDDYTAETTIPIDTVEAVAYYTNDLYELCDGEYGYPMRIVRFRSPSRLVGSGLYWDLKYNSGINDWLVYDNGYTIDIYPTSNNPYYYYAGCGINYYNPSAWYVYYNAFTPYWAWSPSWYWHDYHWHSHYWYSSHWHNNHWYNNYWNRYHWHAGYYPSHPGNGNNWRPTHAVHRDVPTNGGIVGNERKASTVSTNNGEKANDRGGKTVRDQQRPRRTVNDANVTNSAASSRDSRGGAADVRRQQPRREVNENGNGNASGTRNTGTAGAVRQQPQRGTATANVRESNNERGTTPVRRSENRTSNSNTGNSNTGNYRSGSSSSGSSSRVGSPAVPRSNSYSGSSSQRTSTGSGASRGGSSNVSRGGGSRR